MPVIFNEPLSFLQRLAEYMEHTFLVHQANACSDSVERMKVGKRLANGRETLQKLQPLMWIVCLSSVCSVWLPLQCRLWPPSGSVQVNPSTRYWEKPMNWSGEWDFPMIVNLTPYQSMALYTGARRYMLVSERIWASDWYRSRWAIILQSVRSTLRGWRMTLCFMDPSTPNSSSGARVWKRSRKAPSHWSFPSKRERESPSVFLENNYLFLYVSEGFHGLLVCSTGTMKSTHGQILHVAFTTSSWVNCGLSSMGMWKWSTTGKKRVKAELMHWPF